MKVSHGSYTEIDKIDLFKGELARDFGQGFYVTNLYRQAEYWATRSLVVCVVCIVCRLSNLQFDSFEYSHL